NINMHKYQIEIVKEEIILTQQSQGSLFFFGRMNITEKGSRELNMTGWNFRDGACNLKLRRDESYFTKRKQNESIPQAKYFVYPNFVDKNTSTFHMKEAKKARLCYPIFNKNIRIPKKLPFVKNRKYDSKY
ncbi:unnamed protein product, partial [Heterotrigona itama]